LRILRNPIFCTYHRRNKKLFLYVNYAFVQKEESSEKVVCFLNGNKTFSGAENESTMDVFPFLKEIETCAGFLRLSLDYSD
jgi:hypothetical protein